MNWSAFLGVLGVFSLVTGLICTDPLSVKRPRLGAALLGAGALCVALAVGLGT